MAETRTKPLATTVERRDGREIRLAGHVRWADTGAALPA